jgi:hypothetical protein
MRSAFASILLVLATAVPAKAQDSIITIRPGEAARRIDTRQLPRSVAAEVLRLFNAPATLTFAGPVRIPEARGLDGDVGVLGGPVVVAGRISGDLVVINGDLTLERGAVVGGDVLVVGGTVRGMTEAEIAGEVRAFADPLRYRREADTLAYAPGRAFPWRRRADRSGDVSRTRFLVGLGGTYNRVEGIPVVFGPTADLRLNGDLRLLADARAIVRSAHNFSLSAGEIGYRVRGELQLGSRATNIGVGARSYDVVSSVEPWPLKDFEAGWAAVLLREDYRDWYRRRGWAGYVALRPSRQTTLTLEGRDERHLSKQNEDPFSLFNADTDWRTNPGISDGRYRTVAAELRFDTRNSRSSPTSGVFVTTQIEATRGTEITGTVDPNLVCVTAPCLPPSAADGNLDYTRLFADARTYLRLSRVGRLNLRLAGGGKLGGDDLPLQQRLSLGFPDPLPGYSFRQYTCGGAAFQGTPALCDRAIVAQAEMRTHLGFDFGPDWANDWGDEDDERWEPLHVTGPDIVVFGDAGSAWMVGQGPGRLPANRLPTLRSYRADLGVGIDFGPLGFYLAKSVGADDQAVTFHVRMGRRF